jgi:hypothetical protein
MDQRTNVRQTEFGFLAVLIMKSTSSGLQYPHAVVQREHNVLEEHINAIFSAEE